MGKPLPEAKLSDLLQDPILDLLLARDHMTRDDLDRVIEGARDALARVPRQWNLAQVATPQSKEESTISWPPAR